MEHSKLEQEFKNMIDNFRQILTTLDSMFDKMTDEERREVIESEAFKLAKKGMDIFRATVAEFDISADMDEEEFI